MNGPMSIFLVTLVIYLNHYRRSLYHSFQKFKRQIDLEKRGSFFQLVYVTYWTHEQTKMEEVTGRRDQVSQLTRDGIHDGIWPRGWKPDSVKSDLHSYLMEKLKSHSKRVRINRHKNMLKELYSNFLHTNPLSVL